MAKPKQPTEHICYQIVEKAEALRPQARVFYQDWTHRDCRHELARLKQAGKGQCPWCTPAKPVIRSATFKVLK